MKYLDTLIERFAFYRSIKRRQNSPQKEIPLKELEKKMKKETLELHEDQHWQDSAQKRDKTFSKALSHKEI